MSFYKVLVFTIQKSNVHFMRAYKINSHQKYDIIPVLLEKKYLKTILQCHDCAETLHGGDIDGDGKLIVLDIDWVLR